MNTNINDNIVDNSLPPTSAININPVLLRELMDKNFPPIDWIVKQLIPAESITAVSGVPASYKTWFILNFALKVATGDLLFDKFETTQTNVFIVDEETGERWMKQRILKLHDIFDLPIYLLSKTGFKLSDESVKQILYFCKKEGVKLVFFDSLVRVHTAKDENDAVEMAKVFRLFQQLTNKGLSVVFTYHNRKQGILKSSNLSQEMRGSSDISAAVDCHLAIERDEDCLTINQTKLRQGEETQPFKVNIIKEDTWKFEYAGEIDAVRTKKDEFKSGILELLGENNRLMFKKEVYDALRASGLEGGYSTFKTTIQEMIDKKEIFTQPGVGNKVYLSLKPIQTTVGQNS